MKECKYTHKINSLLDSQLKDKEAKLLEEHLETCIICKEELESLKAVNAILGSYKEENVSEEFYDRILREENFGIRKCRVLNFSFWRPLTLAASIIIALLSGVYFSYSVFKTDSSSLYAFEYTQESIANLYESIEN